MEENKIKIYSDLTSLYLIKNEKKYSFNKTSKNFLEIQEYNPSPDAKEYNVYSNDNSSNSNGDMWNNKGK